MGIGMALPFAEKGYHYIDIVKLALWRVSVNRCSWIRPWYRVAEKVGVF
jgi:hypothetical protein